MYACWEVIWTVCGFEWHWWSFLTRLRMIPPFLSDSTMQFLEVARLLTTLESLAIKPDHIVNASWTPLPNIIYPLFSWPLYSPYYAPDLHRIIKWWPMSVCPSVCLSFCLSVSLSERPMNPKIARKEAHHGYPGNLFRGQQSLGFYHFLKISLLWRFYILFTSWWLTDIILLYELLYTGLQCQWLSTPAFC